MTPALLANPMMPVLAFAMLFAPWAALAAWLFSAEHRASRKARPGQRSRLAQHTPRGDSGLRAK